MLLDEVAVVGCF